MRKDLDSFGFLIVDLARLLRAEMDRRIGEAGFDLTPGERRALMQAARIEPARQTVLAEYLAIEAMTVTGYLDRLEARGLVERLPDPEDRRAKLVRVTAAGNALIEHMAPIGQAMMADVERGVPAHEWSRVIEALKTVRTNITQLRAEGTRKRDAA